MNNVTKNELSTMTESFDITTTKSRLAESEEAIARGIARLREMCETGHFRAHTMDATLDMIQTETKKVEMFARFLGEMNAR